MARTRYPELITRRSYERIRDKVAASKRKGMWMGGAVPLGYDVKDKALVVNQQEAKSIKAIFSEYLALGSVRALSKRLDALGIVSKHRTDRHGRVTGGTSFSRGALYNILRNSIYIGKTRHKEELHDGVHDAIIDEATWQRVQTQLADHGGKRIGAVRRTVARQLDGKLFDAQGRAMRTTYASKSVHASGTKRTKHYWYYITAKCTSDTKAGIERLPADEIERVVLNGLKERLADTAWLVDQANALGQGADLVALLRSIEQLAAIEMVARTQAYANIIERIDALTDRLVITVDLCALSKPDDSSAPFPASFEIPFQRRQTSRAKPIVIAAKGAPQRDPDLIALVADARRWAAELLSGKTTSIQQITEPEGLRSGSVSRVLPLAWLAPDISAAILEGRQPPHLTAKYLRNLTELPLDWAEQRRALGFAQL